MPHEFMEGSHNGIAAVLKTAGRKAVRVRIPRPPLLIRRFSPLAPFLQAFRQNGVNMIVKIKEGYRVVSESGRNMGTYKTKEEAARRLRQVEFFKHKKQKAKTK